MTIVYIPKTIETVEEAEDLPDGTMARKDEFDGWIDLAVKGSRGWARVDSSPTDRRQDDAMVGWSALIPVEAEEWVGAEIRYDLTDKSYEVHVLPAQDMEQARWQIEHNADHATGRIMLQYRTPWEEAS